MADQWTVQASAEELARMFNAAGPGFRDLADVLWGPLGAALAEHAAPVSGQRVLDACCGSGASALPAARAVGPHGQVDGVDLAEELLAQAQAQAEKEGVDWLRLLRADVTCWRSDQLYDLVQCGFGVFFLPDMDRDVARLLTLLRPGGRFAVMVWAQGAWDGVLGALTDALVAAGVALPPAPASRAAGERLRAPASLSRWLDAFGLVEVSVTEFAHRVEFSGDRAWSVVLGTGLRRMLDTLDSRTRARVREIYLTRLQHSGIDHLAAPALIGTAQRSPIAGSSSSR